MWLDAIEDPKKLIEEKGQVRALDKKRGKRLFDLKFFFFLKKVVLYVFKSI